MLLKIIAVGRLRNPHARALFDDYYERLRRFTRCEHIEVKESKRFDGADIIAEESERILSLIGGNTHAVLLDIEGDIWSSHNVAKRLEDWQTSGAAREATFIIGGHLGTSSAVKTRVNFRWSLGRITLPHELARVVLAEQLYRAYTIMHGLPYQK